VQFFSPLYERQSPALYLRRAISRVFTGRKILPDRDPTVINNFARQITRKLRQEPVDVIFSHGTIPISLLDCQVPIVFWSDTTFAGMIDFYPGFTNVQRESLGHGNRMEQAALSRAALAIYSSEWAAGTCLDHYQVDRARVEVVPFGPNFEEKWTVEEIDALIRARSVQTCRLIFSGVDWQRKSGDLALRLAEALNRAGLRSELAIIGCRPPQEKNLPEYVKVVGYLDTTTPAGRREYEAYLARTHFLVLPTRADCSPRVVYEANAMGVPCITSDVGGLPTTIRKDVNGAMFPADGRFVQSAADYILGFMQPGADYAGLAARTVRYHKERHTWDISARRIVTLLERLCTPSSGR
jgi:glycosyltransferase involved in cell wall biosynthesis